MSDDVPLQLPRYVFRRANGSFRYKRNVPERLRPLIGKATLYRQLGDSYREAMQALPLVHARIEALLNDEANKSARERSLEIIRGALGDEVAEMVLAETVPEYSPIEDALNELGKDLHRQKMPTEVVQQVYTGKLKPDVLTLAMTLDQYEAYKSDTPKAAREIGQRIERLRTDMKSVFGKQKLKYTPLTDITRQDANDLRDHLLEQGLSQQRSENAWCCADSHQPCDCGTLPDHPQRLHQPQDKRRWCYKVRQASADRQSTHPP